MMKRCMEYVSLLFVLLLCVCGLSACGDLLQGNSGSNNSSNQSTIQLTLAPNPTSTPAVAATATAEANATTTVTNAGPAILGASLDAFIAKFGQPNARSADSTPHFKACNNSNVDQIVLSESSIESDTGPITTITAQACTPWTSSFATTYCSSFLPADAKFQKSVQHPASPGQPESIDKIYYSQFLAQEFAAEDFNDGSGNNVQPGLFDVDYLYASDASHIGSCQLELGTQQA